MPTKKRVAQAVKASNLPPIYRAYYQKLLEAMPDALIEYFHRAFGVDFWSAKPLSCGTHGCAWDVGHGKIIKITQDATDARVAIALKDCKEFQDVIPEIVCVFQIGNVFGIVMERVTPLEKSGHDFVGIDEAIENVLDGVAPETEVEDLFARKIQRLESIFEATGFNLTWDCFAGNWGLRDPKDLETAVLYDLGLHRDSTDKFSLEKKYPVPQLSL